VITAGKQFIRGNTMGYIDVLVEFPCVIGCNLSEGYLKDTHPDIQRMQVKYNDYWIQVI